MPRTRPPYSAEFRHQLIQLVRAGRTPEEPGGRCHPLEGPLSTPDTSPCPSLPSSLPSGSCVVSDVRARVVPARCGVARPCSRVFGTEIPHQPPIGIKVLAPGDRLQHPWHFCAPRKSSVPGRVQGWRTAAVSYPENGAPARRGSRPGRISGKEQHGGRQGLNQLVMG